MFVNGPSGLPAKPILQSPKQGTFAGGKTVAYIWDTHDRACFVRATSARDSGFTDIVDTYDAYYSAGYTFTLPADGSKIYWRVQGWNHSGWGVASETSYFYNDCNVASIGSGGGLYPINTCSDENTALRLTGYQLKDISRRGIGRMVTGASITTGLNSDNLRIEAGGTRMQGTQIVPLTSWAETDSWNYSDFWFENDKTNSSDAIYAHVYTSMFYEYLLSNFKKAADGTPLNSFNGAGSSMFNQIGGGSKCSVAAAFWDTETWNVHFCQAGGSQYPELIGHEWGHATSAASNIGTILDYNGESGALEEGYADWMGLAFKHAKFTVDWKFASTDFSDITAKPNYYNGNSFDFRGSVWKNSRLPSTMFYLFASGGEHPFSKIKAGGQAGGTYSGVGISQAMQVAYRAKMEKWAANTRFQAAANDMIELVKSDYPNNLYQLKNAWAAVGVCDGMKPLEPSDINSKKMSCGLPAIVVKAGSNGTVTSTTKTTPISNSLDNITYDMQYEPVWGQQVTVTATPAADYEFVNWMEGGSAVLDADQNYTFTADRDRTLTARFRQIVPRDFGNINVGGRSAPQRFKISNTIQPTINVIYPDQAKITGDNASAYRIENDTCTGQMLLANRSCTVDIVFQPLISGIQNATFSIIATANGQTVLTTSSPLTGTGVQTGVTVSSTSTAGGTATVSGSQFYGGTATALATPNTGYAFAGWLEDSVIISSAASYSFIVTGMRSLVAQFTATPPVIAIMPLTGTFDTVQTGSVSPPHSFTVINTGQMPLTVSSTSLTGISNTEFTITGNSCSQPLPANSSCTVQVTFNPASAGLKSTRLNITSSDSANPAYVIDLSGYGGTPIMLYKGGYSPDYYTTVQTAYNNATNGNEIKLWATDFSENLTFNRPASVTIRGGYNGNFADRPGKAAIQGSLKISSGTVIIDGLQLGGSSYRSTLKVAIDTPASGTVTSFPSGINCTTSCSSTRLNGDQLTLTATPVGDSVFTGWSGGGCSGTGSCTVTISSDVTVTASFSAAKIAVAPASESFGTAYIGTSTSPQTITVTSSGTHDLLVGTPSFSGANTSDFTMSAHNCSGHPLTPGATCTVQLSFTPASTGAKTASLLIPSNDPQSPVFSVSMNGIGKYPALIVSKTGNGAGTVTSSSGGINCGSSCSAAFTLNTEVTLTATPDFGYTFTGWSGACSGAGSCTLTLDADHTATATFIETPIASCSSTPVMLNGTLYSSIQAAYNAATNNSIIKLLATDIYESFIANRGITVTIDGGYKCSFSTSSGTTVIHGAPDIATGAVTLLNASINQ